MEAQKKTSSAWLERVEDLITILEGSSVGELELTEGGTEIIIKRKPGMVMTSTVTMTISANGAAGHGNSAKKPEAGVAIVAPLTGVYYSAASPTTPAFVNVGDIVQVGQIIALVEAMKVFNEITAELSGRVVSLPAKNGDVVQKGDVLLRIEAL